MILPDQFKSAVIIVYVAVSIVLCAALLLAVYLPPLSAVLRTQDPGRAGWSFCWA